MSQLGDNAVRYFLEQNYCCAESVWLAFADSDKLSAEERAFGNKLAFAWCGGTGAKEFCGALAGGVLVLGRWFGRTPDQERNPELAKYTEALVAAFKAQFSHTACRELKPDGDPKAARQVCSGYVRFVAEKVEELLDKGLEDEEDCG